MTRMIVVALVVAAAAGSCLALGRLTGVNYGYQYF
jgi:hypothetical protein